MSTVLYTGILNFQKFRLSKKYRFLRWQRRCGSDAPPPSGDTGAVTLGVTERGGCGRARPLPAGPRVTRGDGEGAAAARCPRRVRAGPGCHDPALALGARRAVTFQTREETARSCHCGQRKASGPAGGHQRGHGGDTGTGHLQGAQPPGRGVWKPPASRGAEPSTVLETEAGARRCRPRRGQQHLHAVSLHSDTEMSGFGVSFLSFFFLKENHEGRR